MGRKLSKKALHFARVWGDVRLLDDQEWMDLVELYDALRGAMAEEAKTRAPRKPKPGAPEGGAT